MNSCLHLRFPTSDECDYPCRSIHQQCPAAARRIAIRPVAAARGVSARAKQHKPDPMTMTETEDNQSSYFPELVSQLLWRASSMRERGMASCNVCKGEGHVVCPDCGGARVVSKASRRAKAHARAKLASFIDDVERPEHGDEWLVTNRCPTCHGTGFITCPACGGEGFRHQ